MVLYHGTMYAQTQNTEHKIDKQYLSLELTVLYLHASLLEIFIRPFQYLYENMSTAQSTRVLKAIN